MATPQPGAILGDRYRIDRVVGSGGMGTVFAAHDAETARRVALKVLQPGLASRIMRERFHREIELGRQLAHPAIVPVLDGGDVNGVPFLVMPFLEGPSLADRLETGPLPVDEVLRLGGEIAGGLAAAHARDVLHRDIKPDNILFDGAHARLTDFGVAVAVKVSLDERLTIPGEILGTPTYMSPEQALARFELDCRTDIYSLGVVLFEAATGRPPFVAVRRGAALVRRIDEPVPSATAGRPEIPVALDRVLARAMAWHPDHRFPSAERLAAALDEVG